MVHGVVLLIYSEVIKFVQIYYKYCFIFIYTFLFTTIMREIILFEIIIIIIDICLIYFIRVCFINFNKTIFYGILISINLTSMLNQTGSNISGHTHSDKSWFIGLLFSALTLSGLHFRNFLKDSPMALLFKVRLTT